MRVFARRLPLIPLAFFCAALLDGSSAFAADETKPVSTTPPVAMSRAPAILDAVTFSMYSDGENRKLVVTLSPTLVRLDALDEHYSIIYNPRGEDYIGLEHSNDTYWQFSWPEVKNQVSKSKRYQDHMRDLLSQGIMTDDTSGNSASSSTSSTDTGSTLPPTTNSAGAGSLIPSITPATDNNADSSGYIWKQTSEHKTISKLDCVRWTGESVSNPSVDVWCYNGPLPQVRAAIDEIRAMNEPMALVPVRQLVPAFLFSVYDSIAKGGSTPVLVSWGGNIDKNKFSFVEVTTRPNKPELFAIPKLYIKTTLITMDGITQPVGGGN